MEVRLNMTNKQDANGEAESLESGAQNRISSTPEKDALGEKSLDDVSGGAWPPATTKTGTVTPTI
jgi:hypothetical protein